MNKLSSLSGKRICTPGTGDIWDLSQPGYSWPHEMTDIYRNFLAEDFHSCIKDTAVQKGILVQVRQSYIETDWMLKMAEEHEFLAGVVGWVDLKDPQLEHKLNPYLKNPYFVGVRHIVQDEPDDWLADESVQHGLSVLEKKGVPYDLLIWPRHFKLAADIVSKFPKLTFVIDHLAKPHIDKKDFENWREGFSLLSKFPNVNCKISGLTTQVQSSSWTLNDINPYIQEALKLLGASRCMYGSDWPVCTMFTSYERWFNTVNESLSSLSDEDKSAIFNDNAKRIYSLKS